MTCEEVREHILESLDGDPLTALRAGIDAHLDGCDACRRFAIHQQQLDARLATAMAPPALHSRFRPALRERIRGEAVPARPDALLDIVHFASVGGATLASLLLLPFSPLAVVAAGTTIALASYVLLTTLRGAMEDPLEADV